MISKKHLNMVKYNQLINKDKELKLLDELDELDKEVNDDKLAETKLEMFNV
jgi:argininosuccinate lyase